MRPLKPRMTTCQALLTITVIWFLALSISFPMVIVTQIRVENITSGNETENITYCYETWDKDDQSIAYTLTVMIAQYFLPLGVLMFTYIMIAFAIWGKRPPGEKETNRDQRMAKSKRKVCFKIQIFYNYF